MYTVYNIYDHAYTIYIYTVFISIMVHIWCLLILCFHITSISIASFVHDMKTHNELINRKESRLKTHLVLATPGRLPPWIFVQSIELFAHQAQHRGAGSWREDACCWCTNLHTTLSKGSTVLHVFFLCVFHCWSLCHPCLWTFRGVWSLRNIRNLECNQEQWLVCFPLKTSQCVDVDAYILVTPAASPWHCKIHPGSMKHKIEQVCSTGEKLYLPHHVFGWTHVIWWYNLQ